MIATWDLRPMRSGILDLRIQWVKLKAMLRELLPFMQEKVTRLGKAWIAEGLTANAANKVVAGQHLYFRSKLTFTACVFYGQSSVASIFPAKGDLHKMGITNFVEDTQHDAKFTNGLIEVATASMQKDDYGVDTITLLSGLSSGVIVMSPDSYDKLSGSERNVINQWIQQFAQAETMATNINTMLSNGQRKGKRRKGKKRMRKR